jgi:hypothetical protein
LPLRVGRLCDFRAQIALDGVHGDAPIAWESLNGTWSRMCQRRIIPSNATSITAKPLLIAMSRLVFYTWVRLACKLWGFVGLFSVNQQQRSSKRAPYRQASTHVGSLLRTRPA